jgi:hypothetical protein
VPQGLTRAALGLAVACAVVFAASFAIARPNAERGPRLGTKPVPIAGEEATFETPRLGPVQKVPALARPPAPEPVPVADVQEPPMQAAEPIPRRKAPSAQPSVMPAQPVAPQPVSPPPAAPPPVYLPPAPSPPPPPPPEPALSFDDSG